MPRKKNAYSFFNPFSGLSLAMDMFCAGMKTASMLTASAKVIAHRGDMIQDALSGKTPLYQKEFIEMWQEKIAANTEAWGIAMSMLGKAGPRTDMAAHMRDLMRLMQPYHKKATANAKRLGRK